MAITSRFYAAQKNLEKMSCENILRQDLGYFIEPPPPLLARPLYFLQSGAKRQLHASY